MSEELYEGSLPISTSWSSRYRKEFSPLKDKSIRVSSGLNVVLIGIEGPRSMTEAYLSPNEARRLAQLLVFAAYDTEKPRE